VSRERRNVAASLGNALPQPFGFAPLDFAQGKPPAAARECPSLLQSTSFPYFALSEATLFLACSTCRWFAPLRPQSVSVRNPVVVTLCCACAETKTRPATAPAKHVLFKIPPLSARRLTQTLRKGTVSTMPFPGHWVLAIHSAVPKEVFKWQQ
jgi:hypothetical protein